MPANTLSSGYDVDNSCRFDRASADDFTKSSSGGSKRKATFSAWLKWGIHVNTSTEQGIFESHDGTNYFSVYTDGLNLRANNTGGTGDAIYSTQVLRDPSAWYHVVIAVDSDQGTASNRFRMYINGSEVTSFSAAVYPTENEDMKFNGSGTIQVGGGAAGNWDGYMAEVVWIDGLQLTPTSFGEFDEDSGIWKPIDVSDLTFGTNGFYLDFKDSANLGNDANGGTDLGENNIVANNQSTDTCTNNFATMNPLAKGTDIAISQGNLKVSNGNSDNSILGTIGFGNGKFYWEAKCTGQTTYANIGITLASANGTVHSNVDAGRVVYSHNGYVYKEGLSGQSNISGLATFTADDIISVAYDGENGSVKFYKNGTLINTTTDSDLEFSTNEYITSVGINQGGFELNFGSPTIQYLIRQFGC